MAPRATEEANPGGRARKGSNFDPEVVNEFIGRIEEVNDEIASQKAKNAKKCRELSESRDEIIDEAKNAGIPKKVIKAKIKKRDLERQVEACRDDLEGEDQDLFDNLELSLGELGKAAKKH